MVDGLSAATIEAGGSILAISFMKQTLHELLFD
jgi:hypothetical protein